MVTRVDAARKSTEVDESLANLVADGTLFSLKLRHYHWHVRGAWFYVLHQEFEKLYENWNEIVDTIAERLVARGRAAPHSFAEVIERACLISEDLSIPDAESMMSQVETDLEKLISSLDICAALAEAERDGVTKNMLEQARDQQSKSLWMVQSWLLEGEPSRRNR